MDFAQVYAADRAAVPATSTFLVQFQATLSDLERTAVIRRMGGEALAWLPALHIAQVRFQENGAERTQLLAQFRADPSIMFAEEDAEVKATYISNDPDINDQRKVYAPELLNLFSAWDYTTGAPGVIIAVVDSGIDADHPEFADRLLPGYDYIENDAVPDDENGHGTHVAGIIGAGMDNEIGLAGVCATCSLLPVRVLNQHNTGSWSGVAQGVLFAVDQGASVIVLSLGSSVYSQTMEKAIAYAETHGVLVVAAAGNINSSEAFYPAAFPGVLGVGATTAQDQRWLFSNYGPNVDVLAPGEAIYSTYLVNKAADSGYQALTGTSMAAPYVAGLAGLLFAQTPTRTMTDITHIITATAVDLGAPGQDQLWGYGRIDPVAALQSGGAPILPMSRLAGIAWYDLNMNGVVDSPQEAIVPGVAIMVYNAHRAPMGVAVTAAEGNWRMSGLPTGVYTLHMTTTTALNIMPAQDITVALTTPVLLDGLNFGLIPLPTADDVADFRIIRQAETVTLTWSVTHPLVDAVTVQRATALGGIYTTVASLIVDPTRRTQLHFVDELTPALTQANLYYQLLLTPGSAVAGPKEIPVAGANAYQIFAPFVSQPSSLR